MWTYRQSTGALLNGAGARIGTGYSGFGEGKNVPLMQAAHDIGPIPQGVYKIEAPVDTREHGPYVLRLLPDPSNEMFGRSGFLIHGYSATKPTESSHGCIILILVLRRIIWENGDHDLAVIA